MAGQNKLAYCFGAAFLQRHLYFIFSNFNCKLYEGMGSGSPYEGNEGI